VTARPLRGVRVPAYRWCGWRGYVGTMRLTHLGHACLLAEIADTRILIDPGSFSAGFEDLRDLDAVVITHQHADHLDQDRVPALLQANRQATVYADVQSAQMLEQAGADVVTLTQGDAVPVGAVTVHPVGKDHAFNHEGVPVVANIGVVLRADGEPSLFHPGDAYDADPGAVDVLAVPVNAPWCAIRESISFVRRIAPSGIVPIHDGLLAPAGRRLYVQHVGSFGGENLTLHDLADGRAAVID